MDKNNNNINIENNDSNNDLKDKNKKYDESKNIKKNNINYRKSKIKFINGKCGYQILLLTLCNLFKDKDDILDDFENGRNLKDDSPENRDFLKKIAEIVKKYKNSTNNNQIDVDDFIKVYLISLIYNCKKVTLEEFKSKCEKIIFLINLTYNVSDYLAKNKLYIPAYKGPTKIKNSDIENFNKNKEILTNFDYNNIKNNNIKDACLICYIYNFLYYLTIIYNNSLNLEYFNNLSNFQFLNFKGYCYDEFIENTDLIKNKEIFLITLCVSDNVAKHICEIYKENDKYWFCCCNKEIEISYNDIINQRFQKIIDAWGKVKEFETYNYKFQYICDYICIS